MHISVLNLRKKVLNEYFKCYSNRILKFILCICNLQLTVYSQVDISIASNVFTCYLLFILKRKREKES